MTFTQIEYFVEAARTLNFHQAAANKYVTQQVISKQIRSLEQELGMELFDRRNRKKLLLTDAGEILFQSWGKAVEEMKQAITEAREQDDRKKNTVILGIHAISWVIDNAIEIIQKNRQKNTKVRMENRVAGSAVLEEELRNGTIDLLITFSSEISSKDISYCKLGDVKITPAIMMSKTHALAKRKSLDITDLSNETIYLLKNSFSKDASKRVLADFDAHNISPGKIEYFDNAESMETKLMLGEGICIGWDVLFRNKDRLKFFPYKNEQSAQFDFVVCWKDKKYEKIARSLAKT
ncbi:MAG: LysR family transcriptional regulator [Lachnospiraceae bacterium]|nr:LysR family transcriptional regulator [Lachnospiraceae bacterium]